MKCCVFMQLVGFAVLQVVCICFVDLMLAYCALRAHVRRKRCTNTLLHYITLWCVYITLCYDVFTLHYVMVCLHYTTLWCVYITLRYGVFTLHYVTVCLHYITLRCVYSARSKWAKLLAEKRQINFPKRSDISPCKNLNYSLIRAVLPSPPFSSTSSSSPSSSVFHPTNNSAKKINEA